MGASKKKMLRLFVILLAIFCLPLGALRVHADEISEQIITVTHQTVPDVDLPENEALHSYYLEDLFYGSDSVSFFGESARSQLNTLGQKLYDHMKERILEVAAGETASTVIELNQQQLTAWGAELSFAAGDGKEAFSDFLNQFEVENVISALLHDCPYELYWYDKVSGTMQGARLSVGSGGYTIINATFSFAVSANYRASSYDSSNPAVDAASAQSAIKAAGNAKSIVAACGDASDYEKLESYKDEICALVTYNNTAAATGNFTTNSDPWQLIYVFDGDLGTNVVCEGYAKAFQYLCDMTQFNGDISCYSVSGTMIDGTGAGGHMWNIVTIGAENYLVDVTNSDSGTIGQNGGLFLVGDAAGSIPNGYSFCGAKFTYDSDTMALWGTGADSILNLAQSNHNPTISGICGDQLTWRLDEGTDTLIISGTGEMYDYGSANPAPWSHLVKRISAVKMESGITGIGDGAFDGCEALTTVSIPDTLTSIGADAFSNCESLTLSVFCGSYGETYARENDLIYERLHQDEDMKAKITAPTCTEKGYTTHSCGECGDSYVDSEAAALGHRYKAVVTAPTCLKRGYTTYTCGECGDHYVDTYTNPTCDGSCRDSDCTCPNCDCTHEAEIVTFPMYRLYNPYTLEHLYTSGVGERDLLAAAGWNYEGIAWHAPDSGTPVYRLYNPYDDGHFYTTSKTEIDTLTPLGWKLDGVMCFSASAEDGVPIYRLFNPYEARNYHHYTASMEESEWLVSLGWKLEGIAWYGAK